MSGAGFAPPVLRRRSRWREAANPWTLGGMVVLAGAAFGFYHLVFGGAPPAPDQLDSGASHVMVARITTPPPAPVQQDPPQAPPSAPPAAPPPAPAEAPAATASPPTQSLVSHFDGSSNWGPAKVAPPAVSAAAGSPPGAADGAGGVTFKPAAIEGREVSVIRDLGRTLKPTTQVPCVLDVAIDGTHAGPLVCHVQGPVQSWDRTTTLLHKDTPILGSYQPLTIGQGRMMAMAATAYEGNGLTVPLGGDPFTDQLGRIGMDGQVDNRTWERIGNAILTDAALMALQLPSTALQSSHGGNTYVTLNSSSTESVVGQVLQNSVNLPPLFHKNKGEIVNILITAPVHFGALTYRSVP